MFSPGYTKEDVLQQIERLIGVGKQLLLERPGHLSGRGFAEYEIKHKTWVEAGYSFLLQTFSSSQASELFGHREFLYHRAVLDTSLDVITKDLQLRIVTLEQFRQIKNAKPMEKTGDMNASDASYNVLVSWSKPISKELAHGFHTVLPKILPSAQPWFSPLDISKGKIWFNELLKFLSQAKLCVIFVTNENVRSPYLYFESGAISAKVGDETLVCPYLVGCSNEIVSDGPLSKFQTTEASKVDTWLLIKSLNKELKPSLPELTLQANFNNHWPEFEAVINAALEKSKKAEGIIETPADEVAGIQLSSEARTLLLAAAVNVRGVITNVRTRGAQSISVGDEYFTRGKDQRTQAIWIEALDDLRQSELVKPLSPKNEGFRITAEGYRVAEALGAKTQG